MMTFRVSYLFYLLALICFGLIPGFWQGSVGLTVNYRYSIYNYFLYLCCSGLLSLATGFAYTWLDGRKRPVKLWLGLLHFILTFFGLILSLNFYNLMASIYNYRDTSAFAYSGHALLLIVAGPFLLLMSGLIVLRLLRRVDPVAQRTNEVDRK